VSSGVRRIISARFLAAGTIVCRQCLDGRHEGWGIVVRAAHHWNCRVCLRVCSHGTRGAGLQPANSRAYTPHLSGRYCNESWVTQRWFPALDAFVRFSFPATGLHCTITSETPFDGAVHGPIDYVVVVRNRQDRVLYCIGIEVDADAHRGNQGR
jgi:hypothetical protein